MKSTHDSDVAIAEAKKAWDDYQHGERDLERRTKEFLEKERASLNFLRGRVASLFLAAATAGVPKTRLAKEVLGQKGTVLTYELIEEGLALAERTSESTQADGPFARSSGGVITYTPVAGELAGVLEKLGLDAESAPKSADFTVKDGKVAAVTPAFGEGGMHPVVALVMADGSKHAKALIEASK